MLYEICPRCWCSCRAVRFSEADYAELLGLYLGDGYICPTSRTHRLRLFLDAKYPVIVQEAEALLHRCFPGNAVGRVRAEEGRMVVLSVYHRHLPCRFPQHGAGKKHERPIVLEPWQAEIAAAHPWELIRGLIRSDGCSFVNRSGRYEYLSYGLHNLSADILFLFVAACEQLGLRPRWTPDHVRLNRRADVAEMVEHVGMKR